MVLEEGLAQCLTQAHHSEHNGYYYFSLRKLFEITYGGCWPSPWPRNLVFLFLLVWSFALLCPWVSKTRLCITARC